MFEWGWGAQPTEIDDDEFVYVEPEPVNIDLSGDWFDEDGNYHPGDESENDLLVIGNRLFE